jgi:hypothetical protein
VTHLSIPIAVRLTSEASWHKLDERSTIFGIARFHFFLEDLAHDGRIVYGEPFGVYTKPKGVKVTRTDSETTTLERIESLKSIENYLAQREELEELAAEVLANSTIMDVFKLGGSVKERVSRKLDESFSLGEEISSSLKKTKTESVMIENELPSDFEGTMVSVPAYMRREVNLYLTHIDYLRVHYRRTPFGLRKKAKNEPPVIDFQRHSNRIKVGSHFATALYWKLLPKSSCFLMASDHQLEVNSPTEVLVCAPQKARSRKLDFPKVPTLYQISKVAFPKKWIWRKSETKDWTEDELMAIELEEVRHKPGWWRRHGPDA